MKNEILDELLQKMTEAKQPKPMGHWVRVAAGLPKLQHRMAEQLCRKKILRNEEQQIIWIFSQKIYPEIDSRYERATKQRMSKLMFGQTTKHDERTTILVSLAHHTGLRSQTLIEND